MDTPSADLLAPRGTTLRGRALETVVLGYSLIAGAFHSNPPSPDEPEGWLRLAIAVLSGMLGLALRDRRTGRQVRSPNSVVVDLVVVYGSVILSQVVLAQLEPDLVLPRWTPTQGGFVGIMLFSATRALLPALGTHDIVSLSSDTFRQEIADAFRRVRALYGVAGSIALSLGLAGLSAISTQTRIASAWIALGSACLLLRLIFGDEANGDSAIRCQTILRDAAWWHYGALLPASLILLHGSKIYPYWLLPVILLCGEANHRYAASIRNRAPAVGPPPTARVRF